MSQSEVMRCLLATRCADGVERQKRQERLAMAAGDATWYAAVKHLRCGRSASIRGNVILDWKGIRWRGVALARVRRSAAKPCREDESFCF